MVAARAREGELQPGTLGRSGRAAEAVCHDCTAFPKDPDKDYVASHGSVWDYDRRVPILFWWRGIEGFEQPAAVETVDIAPTLADLVGLKVAPHEMDGRVLQVGQAAK